MSKTTQVAPATFSLNTIRTSEGLYSLNDLHKAAGGDKRHQPANWLRNQQTIDLIDCLKSEELKAQICVISQKQKLGTFVCRELVCAYAAWISPAFYLRVIRTFLAQHDNYTLTISPEQQQEIKDLIARVANETGQTHGSLYARFYNKFKIPRYQELPANRFAEAVQYLRDKLPPAQMFYGLRDGRYLLAVDGGKTSIRQLHNHVFVALDHADTIRRNLLTLAAQMRIFSGEAGSDVMGVEMHTLPEATP